MRVKAGGSERRKHKKILKRAKGFRQQRSKVYRRAQEAVLHAEQYARRDRRKRAAQMRRIWITRINAALRADGLKYKDFVKALKDKNIELDRKSLSEMAVNFPEHFSSVVKAAGLKEGSK